MINIDELIARSKQSFELDPDKLACREIDEPLEAVPPTVRLILEPIWQNPIDDIEGRLYRQYIQAHPDYESIYLRMQVAERLQLASANLPQHLKLILRAGHRPLVVQREGLLALIDKYIFDHPDRSPQEALVFARTFIDDPVIKIPSHCCGSAVDVDLFDTTTHKLVDFGSQVNTPSDISFLHSSDISREQYANRMTLLGAMLGAGFAPSFVEWWHYSYGDTVWAYFTGEPESLYGIIEP